MNRREAMQASLAAVVGTVIPTKEDRPSLYAIGEVTIMKCKEDYWCDYLKYFYVYEDGKEIGLLELEKWGRKTKIHLVHERWHKAIFRKPVQAMTEIDVLAQAKVAVKEYKKRMLQLTMYKKIKNLIKTETEFEIV